MNYALGRKSEIQAGESPGDGKDYSQSNSVTILLGENESGGGLRHISSQKATFHAKNASFGNLQNGGADFRIWAKAPELYIRRVTVTRETEQDTRPTR